ncbi:hypothetical protein HDU79_001827 [Rhizoclosmatium sp. JEL0117]|nr:hypothetical protein HDU79_001827 [Rhizoclosmatium sp. JEL0117]
MVYWLRGIDHVVEHYYHTHASYTFSHQSDLLELGTFNWSPRVNQSTDILLGYMYEAQNVPWERAMELEADVFIPSTNYHYNKVFHEQMIWGVYEYAIKSRQDATLYWYATPPKGQHGLSTEGHRLRNGMMRGGIGEINRMSNSSTMKAFVLPSDVFSMSGHFLRNAGGDSHYQCAYLSLYPEPIQSGKLKTPETKDCRDLFNYNLIQVRRPRFLRSTRTALFVFPWIAAIAVLVLVKLHSSGTDSTTRHGELLSQIHASPSFNSSAQKQNAIVVLLTGASSSSSSSLRLDDFCLGALFHAHTFLHNQKTRLDPSSGTDFAVLVTKESCRACVAALGKLGARIITGPLVIPPDSEMGHRYYYTFTKFRMWALEPFYNSILTMDSDLLFLEQAPVSELFDLIPSKQNRQRKPFFGACKDFPGGTDYRTGQFDSALMLFEPSLNDHDNLVDLIPSSVGFGDQRVLTKYYNSNGNRSFFTLPRKFHVGRLNERTKSEIEDGVGFHHKFPEVRLETSASQGLFKKWAKGMQGLRQIQMGMVSQGVWTTDENKPIPLVPPVPSLFEDWIHMRTHHSHIIFDSIALVSFGMISDQEVENRNVVAKTNQQAIHEHGGEKPRKLLIQKLKYVAESMLDRYDWVWVWGNQVTATKEPKRLLLDFLGEVAPDDGVRIVSFGDCKESGGTATLLVNRGARNAIFKVVKESKGKPEAAVWDALTSRFTADEHLSYESAKRMDFYSVNENGCLF